MLSRRTAAVIGRAGFSRWRSSNARGPNRDMASFWGPALFGAGVVTAGAIMYKGTTEVVHAAQYRAPPPPPPPEQRNNNGLDVATIGGLTVLVLGVAFGGFMLSRLKRVPPNQVLVIYGKTGSKSASRCVHGGGAFVWPVIQDYAYLSLEPLQIDIALKGALSLEKIRVNLPSVFTVAIGTSEEYMNNAAVRLLNLDVEDIYHQAGEIIYGQLREVIASMEIEQINRDRLLFKERVSESLHGPLASLGLELMNVNFKDLTDDSGFIQAIGQKAAETAVQQARVDVAQKVKMGEIGEKKARQEQAVSIALMSKEQEIEVAQAKYEQEAEIKSRERAMRVSVAQADAEAQQGENSSRALVQESVAELKVREAEAYRIGEIKKREAEAAVMEAEAVASAKAALAYATQVEAEKRAALVSPALAAKAERIVHAEAQAEEAKIRAEADAAALYATMEAKARGEFQALARKAEGLQMIVNACGGSQSAVQILMLEHVDKLAETTAQAISNIKFDKVVVWDGGATKDGGAGATSNFIKSVAQSLPPALSIMKDVAGVSMPEMLGKFDQEEASKGGKKTNPVPPPTKPAATEATM